MTRKNLAICSLTLVILFSLPMTVSDVGNAAGEAVPPPTHNAHGPALSEDGPQADPAQPQIPNHAFDQGQLKSSNDSAAAPGSGAQNLAGTIVESGDRTENVSGWTEPEFDSGARPHDDSDTEQAIRSGQPRADRPGAGRLLTFVQRKEDMIAAWIELLINVGYVLTFGVAVAAYQWFRQHQPDPPGLIVGLKGTLAFAKILASILRQVAVYVAAGSLLKGLAIFAIVSELCHLAHTVMKAFNEWHGTDGGGSPDAIDRDSAVAETRKLEGSDHSM